jgi:1-acyl-sn-glycerol-3-phosphate acyltransferase
MPHVVPPLTAGYWPGKISSLVIRLNPGWRLLVVGPRAPPLGRSIVVCNHLSNADAFFLSAALLPQETKYIAKADLFHVRVEAG